MGHVELSSQQPAHYMVSPTPIPMEDKCDLATILAGLATKYGSHAHYGNQSPPRPS